jgi:AcrR family transcriptional regulator
MTMVNYDHGHLLRKRMGRREAQKQARKQRIFAAALQLFEARGFAAVTVEEIAAAADIAKGTFFNYFPTKEAVLLHLNELQVARLDALGAAPGFFELPFAEQVRVIFTTLAEGVTGRGELVRVLIGQTLLNRAALGANATVIRTHFEGLLERLAQTAQKRGELRPDIAAAEAARLLMGIYFLTILDWLELQERDLSALLERNLELTFKGMNSHG